MTTEVPEVKQEETEPDEVQIIENDEGTQDLTGNNNNSNNNSSNNNDSSNFGDHNDDEEGGGGEDYEVDIACDTNGLIDADMHDQSIDGVAGNGGSGSGDGQQQQASTANAQEQLEQKKTPSKIIDLKARPRLSRADREKIYKLPSTPHIIVHPSSTAKGNKFNCHIATLSNLLDYTRVSLVSITCPFYHKNRILSIKRTIEFSKVNIRGKT